MRLRQTLWIKKKGKNEAPPHFSEFSGPHLTLLLPRSSKRGWLPSITMSQPNHLYIIQKALLDLYCMKRLGPNSESGWTEQLLVWLIAYLSGTRITTEFDLPYPMWDFHNTWKTTVKTMKMRADSETALCYDNNLHSMSVFSPKAEDLKEQDGLQWNMWLISPHGDSPSGPGWERGKVDVSLINR